MASLVEAGKYGSINTTDTTTNGFIVIMFTAEAYRLQDNTTIDGEIISARKLGVIAQYICYMQVETNWYWNQNPQHHVITVPTRKILHPRLEINAVPYSHAIPKSVYTRTQAKNPYQDILYV